MRLTIALSLIALNAGSVAVTACSAPESHEAAADSGNGLAARVAGLEHVEGFLDLYRGGKKGEVLALLPAPAEDGTLLRAIHAMRLSSGLGSNPVGLDRGWGNAGEIIRFRRIGGKVVAEVENHRYRASAANALEQQAVGESFATSFIWSGEVLEEDADGRVLVDLSELLTKDLLGLAGALDEGGAGFSLAGDLSMAEPQAALSFPDNAEFDAKLTFTSSNPGPEVSSTAAFPSAVTLGVHHSFVRLPDDGYRPRAFDPRTGTFALGFYDFSTPLDRQLLQAYAMRHRASADNPVVFYVDPGAPDRIRDALVEGASWWADAFAAAGLPGAYRVEVLPDGADPLDIRYNVVQWVHRQTRGWSYGGGIIDPRTGEIIKGHVILGSQRVRQDRMIFEGLAGAAKSGSGDADDPVELSLARLRPLAAPEVGHALGFGHNFAASVSDRASVMDYPAPWVIAGPDGTLDFAQAYDTGIGEWDEITARWLYGDYDPATEEADLDAVVAGAQDEGLLYISDEHGRSVGTMHPLAAVWDNGADPVAELDNVMAVRRIALDHFGEQALAEGRSLSALREVFVPVWLYHRYQLAAAAKTLGGAYYAYGKRGADAASVAMTTPEEQRRALAAILTTISPDALTLTETQLDLMEPATDPYWFRVPGETLESRAGPAFDATAAVETAAGLTFAALFHPARAERLVQFHARDTENPSLEEVFDAVDDVVFAATANEREAETMRIVRGRYVFALMQLGDSNASQLVKAQVRAQLAALERRLGLFGRLPQGGAAHDAWLAARIKAWLDRPAEAAAPVEPGPATPPGSPIGSGPLLTGPFLAGVTEPCWHCE